MYNVIGKWMCNENVHLVYHWKIDIYNVTGKRACMS